MPCCCACLRFVRPASAGRGMHVYRLGSHLASRGRPVRTAVGTVHSGGVHSQANVKPTLVLRSACPACWPARTGLSVSTSKLATHLVSRSSRKVGVVVHKLFTCGRLDLFNRSVLRTKPLQQAILLLCSCGGTMAYGKNDRSRLRYISQLARSRLRFIRQPEHYACL